MRIVTWNMNHRLRSVNARKQAWDFLRDGLKADLALVQEAVPPPEYQNRVYCPIDETHPGYNWGSAVVSFRPQLELQAPERIGLNSCYLTPCSAGQLPDSHPGGCAVAHVLDRNRKLRLTAVSVYGQYEMRPGTNVGDAGPRLHRMSSDLTSLFVGRQRPVVLAGDWNITTQGTTSKENEASAVFARLRAWHLVDCIAHTRQTRTPLSECDCPDGDACSHVQTFRSANKRVTTRPQWDYVFASEKLIPNLKCRVVNDDEAVWALSDHCPICVEIDC